MKTLNSERIRWILASGSPRRKQLLENIGLSIEIVKPDVDEARVGKETPSQYVKRLSLEKALAGIRIKKIDQYRGKWILIAADTTVITSTGEILGKPDDTKGAVKMLQKLVGTTHRVLTGLTVAHFGIEFESTKGPQVYKRFSRVIETKVKMRQISLNQIVAYVHSKEPMDKAGAYAAQGLGSTLIERLEGSYFNVVGLPICELFKELELKTGQEILFRKKLWFQ